MGVNSLVDCENCRYHYFTVQNGSDCDNPNVTKSHNCHVLMWDFDGVQLGDICEELHKIQFRYFLSDIHVLETNKEEDNYIAYCFTILPFQKAVEIVSATQGVDWNFLRISVYRGWFTLRVGAKKSGTPHIVTRLEGFCLPDCEPTDLKNWVEYETLDRS